MRKESRVLNGNVSSFAEKELDVAELQKNEIRSKEHSMDLGSDNSLERASEGEGEQQAMAIEEGATPSNVLATTDKKSEQ